MTRLLAKASLSLQTSLGFLLTLVSTWLVPRAASAWGWPLAFAFLDPGPLLGTLAMAALRRQPESAKLAQGGAERGRVERAPEPEREPAGGSPQSRRGTRGRAAA